MAGDGNRDVEVEDGKRDDVEQMVEGAAAGLRGIVMSPR